MEIYKNWSEICKLRNPWLKMLICTADDESLEMVTLICRSSADASEMADNRIRRSLKTENLNGLVMRSFSRSFPGNANEIQRPENKGSIVNPRSSDSSGQVQ